MVLCIYIREYYDSLIGHCIRRQHYAKQNRIQHDTVYIICGRALLQNNSIQYHSSIETNTNILNVK